MTKPFSIDEIEARLKAAPCDWTVKPSLEACGVWNVSSISEEDAIFIAHAPTDIEKLLRAYKIMRESLLYYSSKSDSMFSEADKALSAVDKL